jgi:hypothetical protein
LLAKWLVRQEWGDKVRLAPRAGYPGLIPALLRRQALLQYFTSCHTLSHFLRQENGRPHTRQVFAGMFDFLWAIHKLR